MKIKYYPEKVTEVFDDATFHITYCIKFIKKFLKKDILEVGAGCGSFTKIYKSKSYNSITLTEIDKNNLKSLKQNFYEKKFFITNKKINKIKRSFDSIMYLHVL